MRTRYRVAVQGFNTNDRGALALCLQFSAGRRVGYEEVVDAAHADFLIVDADADDALTEQVRAAGRLRDAVFVGARPVAGALSRVARPIDADAIVRELDELLALRRAEAAGVTVEVGLPLDERMPSFEASGADADAALDAARPESTSAWGDAPTSIERAGALAPPEPPTLDAVIDRAAPPAPQAEARPTSKEAARAAARRARLRDSPPTRAGFAAPPDVLVLDDSEIALRFLCRLLGDFGFRAHPVRDSAAAWALLQGQRFAVAFLDIVLDESEQEDGIALCQRIKQQPPRPDRGADCVMLVSGDAQPADQVRARLAGGDAFLAKPLSRGSVARALEGCGVALPADARRL
jgi:CheY-like chemotaxis protein